MKRRRTGVLLSGMALAAAGVFLLATPASASWPYAIRYGSINCSYKYDSQPWLVSTAKGNVAHQIPTGGGYEEHDYHDGSVWAEQYTAAHYAEEAWATIGYDTAVQSSSWYCP